MAEPKDTNLGGKCSETEFLVVQRAVEITGTTVSAFIREAVLPAAREAIVQHAIRPHRGAAA